MYNSSDPRTSLATARSGPAATEFAAAEYLKFHDMQPTDDDANGKTWFGRGQNFIIAYSECLPGAVFHREAQADEYVVLLPDRASSALITWDGKSEAVNGYTLVFVPPGDSTVSMPQGGRLVRMFTTRSEDLASVCANSDAYAVQHPNITTWKSVEKSTANRGTVSKSGATRLMCRRNPAASGGSGVAPRSW